MARWSVGPARLANRDYSAPGAYFVTICAFEKQLTFGRPEVNAVIEWAWAELTLHYGTVQLDAFVVMPNHVHGVLFLGDGQAERSVGPLHAAVLQTRERRPTLGTIVRSFKAAVTRELRIRSLHDASPVWQSNYYDRVIRDDAELNRIREYIAYNPVAWQYDRENPERTANGAYERAWEWLES